MEFDEVINNACERVMSMNAVNGDEGKMEGDSVAYQLEKIAETAEYIRGRIPSEYYEPIIGIVCGSGLSNLTSLMTETVTIPYDELPNFPMATVSGHCSDLAIGKLNGIIVAGLRGRFHYYEGHDLKEVVFPIRVLSALGVKNVIITNAAGGIDETFTTGDLMVIEDHISFPILAGISPLRGENLSIGPRFPAMTEAYLPQSYKLVSNAAQKLGILGIKRGTYVGVGGPSYETPAEVRFLRSIGGSAVGMSTIPEVIAAVHAGMKVLAISLITNVAISKDARTKDIPKPTHEEVLDAAKTRAKDLEMLVFEFVPTLAKI